MGRVTVRFGDGTSRSMSDFMTAIGALSCAAHGRDHSARGTPDPGARSTIRSMSISSTSTSGGSVKAPMHGKLIAVFVQPGDRVEKGQRLAIVEAMKMEHALVAPADGEVAEIAAEAGRAGGRRRAADCPQDGGIGCGASPCSHRTAHMVDTRDGLFI